MKPGHLSQYFTGIASKTLRLVETDPTASNQHEFNGVNSLRQILGGNGEPVQFDARFIYLTDDEADPFVADCAVSWYDSRRDNPNRAAEYRLYFQSNAVMEMAVADDLLVMGRRPDGSLLIIVAEAGSTLENQVRWLFGLAHDLSRYQVKTEDQTDDIELDYTAKLILEQLGIEVEETADDYLATMIEQFGGTFPTTRTFSDFARSTVTALSPLDDPDACVIDWMDREETLFRTLERHIVGARIAQGFGDDVDAFISFSLSVHNRRKSRAGHALENHLETIFQAHGIRYSRGRKTENNSKPDFVFPGIDEYHDDSFSAALLTMLGAKSTCKDRWRQVLSEALRIPDKHLLTLEPGISTNQTDEMKANSLQLVIPQRLHATYTESQRSWLMPVRGFLELVAERQAS